MDRRSGLQHDRLRLTKAYRLSVASASAILYPAFAGLGVVAPELIQLLFGSKWAPASPYVFALSAVTFLQIARFPSAPLLSSIGYVRDVAAANLAKGRLYPLVFILPASDNSFMHGLHSEVLQAIISHRADGCKAGAR